MDRFPAIIFPALDGLASDPASHWADSLPQYLPIEPITTCHRSHKTHGLSHDPECRSEYWMWQDIKKRCYCEKREGYENYGGRSIGMYEPWINDFGAFYAYVGKRPGKEYSLGRIDNDGNYEPDNLQWELRKDQQNNTRANRWIEFRGERLTIAQAAEKYNVNYDTLRSRLDQRNWSIEDALTIPVRPFRKLKDSPCCHPGKRKLFPEQVLEIRHVFATTDTPKAKLARQFGVTSLAIADIVNRKSWKHL